MVYYCLQWAVFQRAFGQLYFIIWFVSTRRLGKVKDYGPKLQKEFRKGKNVLFPKDPNSSALLYSMPCTFLWFLNSSSKLQGCYDDDCYAEILKDDIVDLGKSFLPPALGKSQDERSLQPIQEFHSPVSPFQGTANRRIRLSKIRKHRANVLEVEIGKTKYVEDESSSQNTERSPKCFMRLFSGRRIGRHSLSMFLVFLTLLIFCFSMLGVPGKPKKGINMLP